MSDRARGQNGRSAELGGTIGKVAGHAVGLPPAPAPGSEGTAADRIAAPPSRPSEDADQTAPRLKPQQAGTDRIQRILALLRNTADPDALALDLAAEEDRRLQRLAAAFDQIEKKRQENTERLAASLAAFQRRLNTTIQESQEQQNLEDAEDAYHTIKSLYWEALVEYMKARLKDAAGEISVELDRAAEELKARVRTSMAETPSLTQRAWRERWLLAAAVAAGVVIGAGLMSIDGAG